MLYCICIRSHFGSSSVCNPLWCLHPVFQSPSISQSLLMASDRKGRKTDKRAKDNKGNNKGNKKDKGDKSATKTKDKKGKNNKGNNKGNKKDKGDWLEKWDWARYGDPQDQHSC